MPPVQRQQVDPDLNEQQVAIGLEKVLRSMEIADGDVLIRAEEGLAGLSSTTLPSALPTGEEGALLYHNGTDWAVLGPGSEGQVLKMTSGIPTWSTP